MFNKNNKGNTVANPSSNNQAINIISEGAELNGSVATNNDIRIAGKIDGQATCKGKLVLTSNGYVKGNIVAGDGDIAGRVDGEVHVSGVLILRKTAKITGDIHTKTIIVEEGAVFNGCCKMSSNPLEGIEKSKKATSKETTNS